MKKLRIDIPPKGKGRESGSCRSCTICNRIVADKCYRDKKKPKPILSCPNQDSHRYAIRKWNPFQNRSEVVKIFNPSLDNYEDYRNERRDFLKTHTWTKKEKKKKFEWPKTLNGCIQLYVNYIKDLDELGNPLPKDERVVRTNKWINQVERHFKNFTDCLRDNNINPVYLTIWDVDRSIKGLFHEYLEQYANSTYNHHVSTMKSFFEFLIKKGYKKLSNPWDSVKLKPKRKKTDIVELDDFRKTLDICSTINGWKEEKKGGGRIGKKQMYRPYLTEGFEYALFSGERLGEIVERKLGDLMGFYIDNINFKATKLKRDGVEIRRVVPLPVELIEFLKRIKEKYNLGPEDYIIGPEEEKRTNVAKCLSGGFSHFHRMISPESEATFHSLRTTYATRMIQMYGPEFLEYIGMHSDPATTIHKYTQSLKFAESIEGFQFMGG